MAPQDSRRRIQMHSRHTRQSASESIASRVAIHRCPPETMATRPAGPRRTRRRLLFTLTALTALAGCKQLEEDARSVGEGLGAIFDTGETQPDLANGGPAGRSPSTRPEPASAHPKTPHSLKAYPQRVLEEKLEDGSTHLELKDFESVKVQQEDPLWCWAACAQMVSRYLGKERSQQEVVAAIKGVGEDGSPRREAATRYEILCSLVPDRAPFSPIGELAQGIAGRLGEDPMEYLAGKKRIRFDKGTWRQIKNESLKGYLMITHIVERLRNGYPYVVGLSDDGAEIGHAWVLYGVTYRPNSIKEAARDLDDILHVFDDDSDTRESSGFVNVLEDFTDKTDQRYDIEEVLLIDPWYGQTKTMRGEVFRKRLDFAMSSYEASEELDTWRSLAQEEDRP